MHLAKSKPFLRTIKFIQKDKQRIGLFDIIDLEFVDDTYLRNRKLITLYQKIDTILIDYKNKYYIQNYEFQHDKDKSNQKEHHPFGVKFEFISK